MFRISCLRSESFPNRRTVCRIPDPSPSAYLVTSHPYLQKPSIRALRGHVFVMLAKYTVNGANRTMLGSRAERVQTPERSDLRPLQRLPRLF